MAILCASRRTDLPACYWDWFLTRYEIGWVQVRNPNWPEKISTYDLSPEATQGFLFMSKDYRPMLGSPNFVRQLIATHPATTFHATLTAYSGTQLQPGCANCDTTIATIVTLSDLVGPERVTWLLGPLFAVDGYVDATFAIRFLDYAVPRLAGHVRVAIPADLNPYEHVLKRAPWLRPFAQQERDLVWGHLSDLASTYGMPVTICPASKPSWPYADVKAAPCLSKEHLSEVAGAKVAGSRARCGCINTRDIVGYVPCGMQCAYCYARPGSSPHVPSFDPSAPMLLDVARGDEIVSGKDVLAKYGVAYQQPRHLNDRGSHDSRVHRGR